MIDLMNKSKAFNSFEKKSMYSEKVLHRPTQEISHYLLSWCHTVLQLNKQTNKQTICLIFYEHFLYILNTVGWDTVYFEKVLHRSNTGNLAVIVKLGSQLVS